MRLILARLVWEYEMELISHEVDWNKDSFFKLLWVKLDLRVRYTPVIRG